MPLIIIYSDFDGTITGRSGDKTVYAPFYQSLLAGYQDSKKQDYKKTPMLPSVDVQRQFNDTFGAYTEDFDYSKPDADILMSRLAVAFFHELLNNEDVRINIVTKNRNEYIKELFLYHGFSKLEINKLMIMESGDKEFEVNYDLDSLLIKPTRLYLFDDTPSDLFHMVQAARKHVSDEKIYQAGEEAGQFKWDVYLEKIMVDLGTQPHEKKTKQIDPPNSSNEVNELREHPIPPHKALDRNAYSINFVRGGVGFVLGFIIGVLLVVSGSTAPFGVDLFGTVLMGLVTALGIGGVAGSLGVRGAEVVGSKPVHVSLMAMQGLGGRDSTPQKDSAPVAHFPSVLADTSVSQNGDSLDESLVKKMN